MTKQQIAEALNMGLNTVNIIFETAFIDHPDLRIYNRQINNRKGYAIDYTYEQVLTAMAYAHSGKGLTPLEKILLEEEFSMRKPEEAKAIGIDGTDEFLDEIEIKPKKKCCSTCVYCTKSTIRNRRTTLRPYCNLYQKLLKTFGANPYNDYCRQWKYSEKPPLIFYKDDSSSNVDIYGNVKNTVMGIDVKNFKSKSDKKGRLVTDAGIDDIESLIR